MVAVVAVHAGTNPCGVAGAGVVVHVQDAIHSRVDHIIHRLLHPPHPAPADEALHGSFFLVPFRPVVHEGPVPYHVGIPCHGHSDGLDSGVAHHVDEGLRGGHLSPCLLVIGRRAVRPALYPHVLYVARIAVQRVAQVPSQSCMGHDLFGRLEGVHVFDCFGPDSGIGTCG